MAAIRPIRNDADHQAALARIERLWSSAPGTAEGDELEVLSTLVDVYERTHHPIDPPSAIDAIRFRMEQMAWTRKDLERAAGITRARVSEILSGKRSLSVDLIRTLRDVMGISADALIGRQEPRRHGKRSSARKKSSAPKKPSVTKQRSVPKSTKKAQSRSRAARDSRSSVA